MPLKSRRDGIVIVVLCKNIMPSLRDSGFWLIDYSYHNAIPTGFLALFRLNW